MNSVAANDILGLLYMVCGHNTETDRGPILSTNVPGPNNPARMLDIMPSLQLIRHEWSAHGTCSGLSENAPISTWFAVLTIKCTFQSVSLLRRSTSSSAAMSSGANSRTQIQACAANLFQSIAGMENI